MSKQILVFKNSKNADILKYNLDSYSFDLTDKQVVTNLLQAINKRYNKKFDTVVEEK